MRKFVCTLVAVAAITAMSCNVSSSDDTNENALAADSASLAIDSTAKAASDSASSLAKDLDSSLRSMKDSSKE